MYNNPKELADELMSDVESVLSEDALPAFRYWKENFSQVNAELLKQVESEIERLEAEEAEEAEEADSY